MLSVIQNGEVFTFDEADNGLDITHTFFIHDGVAHIDGVIVKDDGSDGGVPNPFPEPFPVHLFDCMTDCYYLAESGCGAGPASAEAGTSEAVVADPVVAEPVVAAPVAAEPVAAEPVAADPAPVEPVVAEPVVAEPVALVPTPGTDLVQFAQSGTSTVSTEADGLLIADDDGNTFAYSGDPGSELVLVGMVPEVAA